MRTGYLIASAIVLFLAGAGGGAALISAAQQETVQVIAAPQCKDGSATCPPWQRRWGTTNLQPGSILTSQSIISSAPNHSIKAVSGIILAMFGSFFSAWLGYKFGKVRDDRIARIRATVDFRDAVLVALIGVYPHASAWPDDPDKYFRAVFSPMQLAVSRFRPFVSTKQRAAFDRAWAQYRLGDEGREIDVQLYHDYMAFGSNPDPKKRLHDNVAALLKFAD